MACALAIVAVVLAATVATVTQLGYGRDVAGGPRRLTTNGLVQPELAATIFLGGCVSGVVCLFFFYWFHFRDQRNRGSNLMVLGFLSVAAILTGCASGRSQASALAVRSGECLLVQFTNRSVPEMREVVDAGGNISLPYVGKLHVSGLTLQEVREAILTAYQTVERPLEISVGRCP
jgi:hypothetical protein